MTDEEHAAVRAETQAENNAAENAPAENATAETVSAETAAPAGDADNFGENESGADNFGDEASAASAAVEFEDNFGLGEQQLAAGRIPSVPSSGMKKKEPAPPVTPRSAPLDAESGGSGLSMPSEEPAADNFDGVNLSVDAAGQAEEQEQPKSREEELFEQFQLVRVPPEFCKYAGWFRAYLVEHPDAMKKLESMLCDEASVAAVRLGMKRLEAFPAPEFRNVVFYFPYGMATESERVDWEAHVERFPEYAELAKGDYPYFDPPQFFYRHGAIFLDSAVTDRLAGGVFYQCGAFCGASLIAMNQYKPSMMYGFEPATGTGRFLQANVKRSGIENVKLYRLCIGDGPGRANVPDHDREGKPCKSEVPVTSLDLFERRFDVKGRVAWIQADVGGMSLPVVRGAEKMIKRDKPLITVAIYHNPEEFFEIVPLLHEWVPEYKFMVRRCQCNLKITYSEITLIAYIPADRPSTENVSG